MAYNPGIQGNATQAFASVGPRLRANINAWQQQQAQDEAVRQFHAVLAAQQSNPDLGTCAAAPGYIGTGEEFPRYIGTGEEFPTNQSQAGGGVAGGIQPGSGVNPIFNSSPGAGIDYQAALKKLMGNQGEDSIFKKKIRSL